MASSHSRFVDRADAGRQLAARLATVALDRPVVYALPRGGVPVGVEIARALHAPLDLVLVRKIGAPGQPELALGAVVEGEPPQTVVNEEVQRDTGADEIYLQRARQRELVELQRRRALYLGDRPRVHPAGCTAIVVDDGLATGATAKAALIALKRRGAARIVLAIPAGPDQRLAGIQKYADLVVCLQSARRFAGVGAFYSDFHQLTDEETIGLLRRGWAECREELPGSEDASGCRQIAVHPLGFVGDRCVPADPRGTTAVADTLNKQGFAKLLLDLLTPDRLMPAAAEIDSLAMPPRHAGAGRHSRLCLDRHRKAWMERLRAP